MGQTGKGRVKVALQEFRRRRAEVPPRTPPPFLTAALVAALVRCAKGQGLFVDEVVSAGRVTPRSWVRSCNVESQLWGADDHLSGAVVELPVSQLLGTGAALVEGAVRVSCMRGGARVEGAVHGVWSAGDMVWVL